MRGWSRGLGFGDRVSGVRELFYLGSEIRNLVTDTRPPTPDTDFSQYLATNQKVLILP